MNEMAVSELCLRFERVEYRWVRGSEVGELGEANADVGRGENETGHRMHTMAI